MGDRYPEGPSPDGPEAARMFHMRVPARVDTGPPVRYTRGIR
jgi:hypothetical protein